MDRMRKEKLALYVGLFVWTSTLIHPLKSDSPCESVLFSFIVHTRSVPWRRGRFCYLGMLHEQTDRHTCGTHVHHVRICPVRPRADKLSVRQSPAAFARQQGCNKKGSISHSFIDGCHFDTPVRRLQFRRGVYSSRYLAACRKSPKVGFCLRCLDYYSHSSHKGPFHRAVMRRSSLLLMGLSSVDVIIKAHDPCLFEELLPHSGLCPFKEIFLIQRELC